MRIICAEKVWRLHEVTGAPDGGHPRLKVNEEVFQEFGLSPANWDPIEVSGSLRVMVDFPVWSLELVAVSLFTSWACAAVGERSARRMRVLALLMWHCATSMSPCLATAGTKSCTVAATTRTAPSARGSRNPMGTAVRMHMSATAMIDDAMAGFALCLPLTTFLMICTPVDIVDADGRQGSLSNHVPLFAHIPIDRGRPKGRRGWPAWIHQTLEFGAALRRTWLPENGMAHDFE